MTPRLKRKEHPWLVLLADDDDDHALLIETALERAASMPLEVRRARNGDEAVEMVSQDPPDLLLLDLSMPGRSGHEVLAHVKGSDDLRRIPVAVLTSSDREEDVAETYGLGGNHFITKPGDPQVMEDQLRSLLKNLRELGGVRRGVRSTSATAESALGPLPFAFRRSLPWIAFLVVFLILFLYAYFSGILT